MKILSYMVSLFLGAWFSFILSSCELFSSNDSCSLSISVQIPAEDSTYYYKATDITYWRSEIFNLQSGATYFLPSNTENQLTKLQTISIESSLGKASLDEGKYLIKSYGFDFAGTLIAYSSSPVQISLRSGDSENVTSELVWITEQEKDSVSVRFYNVRRSKLQSSPFVLKKGENIPAEKIPSTASGTFEFFSDYACQNVFDFSSQIEYNTTVWIRQKQGTLGTEIYVSDVGNDEDSGTRDFPVKTFIRAFEIIQELNDSSASYTIYASGTFTQKISVPALPLSSLTIASESGSSATFDGEGSHQVLAIKSETSFDITLEDVSIQNGCARQGAGINHQGTGLLTVKNCDVSGNRAFSETITNEDGTETIKNANAGGISVTKGSLAVIDTALTNNYAQYNGGAIHISSGGTLTISGNSKIEYNSADYTAAAISVNNGICTMSGGEISNNSGGKGAAVTIQRYGTFILEDGIISNNNTHTVAENEGNTGTAGAIFINANLTDNVLGTFIMKGGKLIQNSAEGNGGAVYNNGGVFTFEGGEISENSARAGAAIYINMGTVIMSGGIISKNIADSGAGVYTAKDNASFVMTGGEILENTASDCGGAVHVKSGIFDVSGSAKIPAESTNNDIYLRYGNTLTVSGSLSDLSGAKVSLQEYDEGVQVLSGDYVAGEYTKFSVVNDPYGGTWGILQDGSLSQNSCSPVLFVSEFGSDSNSGKTSSKPLASLSQAITLLNSYSEAYALTSSDWTIWVTGRIEGCTAIASPKATSLSIEGMTGNTTDILDGNAGGSVLKISGDTPILLKNIQITGGTGSGTSGTSGTYGGGFYISGATVKLSDGVLITGNSVTANGGGIYNNGTLVMNGGTVSGNQTQQQSGGGIFVDENGSVTISDGAKIIGNTSAQSGGGIFSKGVLTMTGGEISGNATGSGHNGGGVCVHNSSGTSTFTMSGGIISTNTSTNGNGVAVLNNGTFTMSGSANVVSDNDVYLMSGRYITVAGFLSATAPVATITPENYAEGTQILSLSTDSSATLAQEYNKFGVVQKLDGTEWGINSEGKLQKQKTLNPSDSADITDPSIPYIIKGSVSTNNTQIDINGTTATTEDSTYYITLDNVNRNAGQWQSSLIIYNKTAGTTVTVYITVIGENKLFGHNHSGIKLSGVSGAYINVILNTVESGSINFDATYSGTTDFSVENVTSTVRVENDCTFSGTSNGTTYTDVDAFFSAAKNSTNGSSFTLTK